jgi:hypothetical protein
MATLLLAAPCWALFFIAVVMAWPIWHYAKEYTLFQRRAVLASVAWEDSAVRRWFWAGHVVGVLQGFGALFWAAVLLAFGALLTPPQWLLLAVDAVVLAAMIPLVRRRLTSQVRGTHLAMVARRWPLLLGNVALLALGFFVIDFFVTGAPDTRSLAWFTVAENAFTTYVGKSECAMAGVLIASANLVDVLTWHASQVLIPGLPRIELKLAAWAMVLLQAGVVAWAFTRFLLGASALVEAVFLRAVGTGARWEFPKVFIFTVLAIAAPFFYLAATLRGTDPRAMPQSVRNVVAWTNPCRTEARALQAMQPALRAELDQARADASVDAGRQVDAALSALFADAEKKVDHYLDWYFSVLGEYQRLGTAVATGDFSKRMHVELERRVFGELRIEEVLDEASRRIAGDSVARFEKVSADLGATLRKSAREKPCLREAIDSVAVRALDRDRFRASIAAGGGVVAAIGTPMLARRVATAMAARLAGRQGFQAAATIAGKVATRRAGTMTLAAAAAGACVPGGPLAALCALVAGAVSWLAIDHALITIDEVRFRDQMRAEILEAVRGVEQQLAADLKAQQQAVIDQLASAIAESIDRVFVPARHGL